MKWVKVAIGAVIAIAVVPMIALSVFNLTQEKVREEVVTFEVLTGPTVTSDTYNELLKYSDYNTGSTVVNNVLTIKVNNIVYNGILNYESSAPTFYIYDSIMDESDYIEYGDTFQNNTGNIDIGDIVEITFEVTQAPILSGVTATLLLLAPVIFVSGVLYFIYNNKQEGI